MADKPWKATERKAAALIGGKRFWANAGAAIDCESDGVVAQVKHVKVCSLAALEALAVEAERQGVQRSKLGVVCIQRRAGAGRPTRMLVVMTAETYREMSGPLPGEPPAA